MRKSMKTLVASGIIAASAAGAPMVFAATQSNDTQDSGQTGHMVQGGGQMGNGMGMMNNGNRMPMMQMMTQMNQMMANCNQMMQTMMKDHHGKKSGSGKS